MCSANGDFASDEHADFHDGLTGFQSGSGVSGFESFLSRANTTAAAAPRMSKGLNLITVPVYGLTVVERRSVGCRDSDPNTGGLD